METLHLEVLSEPGVLPVTKPVLCGVVASGNLEVLVQPAPRQDRCVFEVETTAHGFTEVWEAVLTDFATCHAVGGLAFAIHDAGATPAVVALRLAQALQESGEKP